MPPVRGTDGQLRLGGIDLTHLIEQIGTPTYVYDLDGIVAETRELQDGFEHASHLIAYALKANTSGPIVRALARERCGADVVSGAEMLVAMRCGVAPERIIYSGVAKQGWELDRAIASEIGALQIESVEEIARIEQRARAVGRRSRVSVRVNPGLDVAHATHAHIATGHDAAKFGIRREDVPSAVRLIENSPELELVGMGTHVGSQLASVDPYLQGSRVLFDLVRALRDSQRLGSLAFVDTGGGFGADSSGEPAVEPMPVAMREPFASRPRPVDFIRAARREQRMHRLDDLSLYVEPGRALVAPHGILLARVVQCKVTARARWIFIDAGMNDLLRPALYQARHRIVPLGHSPRSSGWATWRVAGPVCESSDDFGEHLLPAETPDAVAILDAGAYGYTMASRYNGRQLPVEVFLSGGNIVGHTQRVGIESWVDERVAAGQ